MRGSPRRLRVRLTLLYAVPFFICGAVLLVLPLLSTSNTVPVPGQPPTGSGGAHGAGVHHTLNVSFVGLSLTLVFALVAGWLIAGRFLRPLRTIIGTARDISATNLHRRLPGGRGNDEFTELAGTLNDLFARLEAAFESQRHFVANASHELRTPLTAERTLLQVAIADPHATVDTLRAACEDVLAVSEAQERLIEAMLTLATSEQGVERREPFDLAALTGTVLAARAEHARARDIRVDSLLVPAPADGDPFLVESLVANLLDNALRHNAPGGWVEVTVAPAEGGARLRVRNTGAVVPPAELDRLFRPFQQLGRQRTRRAGGHGLGLAIVRAIASAHRATLNPTARPDGGLDVEVTFPRTT